MGQAALIVHCLDCQGRAHSREWHPPKGIAPQLRAFKCLDCGAVFYLLPRVRHGELIGERQKEFGAPDSEGS